MPECAECGGHVTRDYVRVFGLEGEVDGCPHCMSYREIQAGDAVPQLEGDR